MGITRIDNINAVGATAKLVSNLPQTPQSYYTTMSDQESMDMEWRGGEMAFLTTQYRLYIQQNTSGRTPVWKRLLETFVTTSSTSTTTSTTTTTTTTSTTTTSTTTTTTSTSTSTTTSTSTSTSSTTTA